ncbi:hypothetical protein GCM10011519_31760 [Marmoricola endophyticus]|uniref:DUF664 domain-containing protein n=1 Tax=Marmoricola endophyticus TaxID=2040280 RepID=A0A917BV33_9ACTN|nr:DUF664 domain-containing protein [Marmoricola endophyticus]GGF55524.1 hypothetical protein GCM10011519_31760 [Marmoricola endophyticus]
MGTGRAKVFVEATAGASSRNDVLVGYLDYFRASIADRLVSLGEDVVRRSGVPSGWTPVELAVHLTNVERRWLVWGFLGEDVADPWADHRDERWYVPAERTLVDVLEELERQGARTREIVRGQALDTVGRPGPRWDGADPPTLERVVLHLVQEYARHLGHLDVVTELAGGSTGE